MAIFERKRNPKPPPPVSKTLRIEESSEEEPSATLRVLLLYELLEHILLHLPLPDLLLAQRVCRRWKDVTSDSDSINKALFRIPFDDRKILFTTPAFLPPGILGRSAAPFRSHWRTREQDPKTVTPILNPFLHADLRKDSVQDLIRRTGSAPAQNEALEKGGSWERMLLLQPVPTSLLYQCQVNQPVGERINGIHGTTGNAFHLDDVAAETRRHIVEVCKACRRDWELSGRQMFRGISLMKIVPSDVTGWQMLAHLHSAEVSG